MDPASNEKALNKKIQFTLKQIISQVGSLQDDQLHQISNLLGIISERITTRFSSEAGITLSALVQKKAQEILAGRPPHEETEEEILPDKFIPSEIWEEIFSQAEPSQFYKSGLMRINKTSSRAAAAEKIKRYYIGELTLEDFGCSILNPKEAIACIKALHFLFADLSRFINFNPELLKELIRDCPHLERLILPEMEVIPAEIGAMKNLESLTLTTSSALPKEMGQLQSLSYLKIDYVFKFLSPADYLPEELEQLQNLKSLCLTCEVDKRFYKLPKLERLSLECTSLSNDIQNLENLKYLFLKGSISTLPEGIGNLRNLVALDLTRTNIKKLPKSIENLTKLKTINFRFNPFLKSKTLHDQLSRLENLKSIGIHWFSFNPKILKMKRSKELTKEEFKSLVTMFHTTFNKLKSEQIIAEMIEIIGLDRSARQISKYGNPDSKPEDLIRLLELFPDLYKDYRRNILEFTELIDKCYYNHFLMKK